MKSAILWLMGLSILVTAGTVYAGTVYQWTDENGVRHFSNTAPPDNVEEVEKTAEKRSTPEAEEQAEQEALREQEEIISNAPDPGTSSTPTLHERDEQRRQERFTKQVDEERKYLENEIARLDKRGMSPSFTQGMKEDTLKPLREQLSLLNADPAAYFRKKEQGGFVRGGRSSRRWDPETSPNN